MEKLNKEEIHNEETIVFQRLAPSPFNRNYSIDANKDNLDILAYDFDVELMKHYENIKEYGDYITYNANIRPIINDNNWNNATYYLYKYIIDNIPFCCNYIELDYGKFYDKISFKDYTKALHNLTYIKNVDFYIENNKWKIKKVKLLAKTNVHGIFIVDHIILSKGELWFMCEVINELYNGKYKIDGDGSIILEDYIDNRK